MVARFALTLIFAAVLAAAPPQTAPPSAAPPAAGTPTITAAARPTFHKDIEPILQARCQSCHRPGEIGPFPLLSYEHARPRARAIRAAVLRRTMPPWFAAEASHPFSNDASLTAAEIATLQAWADAGAPRGNPSDAPPPKPFVSGWNIAPPDAVFEMTSDFDIPAQAAIDYMHIVLPTGFTEDQWIQMVEVRPSNRAAVHHVVVYIRPPGSRWLDHAKPGIPAPANRAGAGQGQAQVLTIYAPGMTPDMWPSGTAKLIPKGWDIILQVHYTTNGTPGRDRSKIGLVFAKAPVTQRVVTMSMMNVKLTIPPGEPNYRAEGRGFIPAGAEILSFFPHMHLRGKAFEYRAVHPDGTRETLLRVDPYRFHWQLAYRLAEPLRMPAGTRIECTGWYDNSPNNKFNPDPTATVKWGEQSWDEMMAGFFDMRYDARLTLQDLFGGKGAEPAHAPRP